MDTNLIISSTTATGKKGSKAISNINPEKDNSTLKTFAQMFNGLSTNTYVDATRVDKQSVNEEGGGGGSGKTLTVTTSESLTQDQVYYYRGYSTIEGGVRITLSSPTPGENYYIDVTLG